MHNSNVVNIRPLKPPSLLPLTHPYQPQGCMIWNTFLHLRAYPYLINQHLKVSETISLQTLPPMKKVRAARGQAAQTERPRPPTSCWMPGYLPSLTNAIEWSGRAALCGAVMPPGRRCRRSGRAPAVTASSIRLMAIWRSWSTINRPLRPPDFLGLFVGGPARRLSRPVPCPCA